MRGAWGRTAARAAVAGLLGAALWAAPRAARAGNTDSFYFSDDAALAAGAVTARTHDSGAIWYNPAGLGGVEDTRINLSGSVLIFRLRDVPGAVNTTVPGPLTQTVDLASSDFTSTPHALGIVRSLSDRVSVGFGVYVTAADLRSATSQVQFAGPPTAPATYQQRIDTSLAGSHYDAGPAIGVQLAPNFRVGMALFGTYASVQGYNQYVLSVTNDATPPGLAFVLGQNRVALSWLGLQGQAGLQWEPAPTVHLGLLVRSPEVTVTSSTEGTQVSLSGTNQNDPTATVFSMAAPTSPLGTFTVVQGVRVVAGIAVDVAPGMWLSAEGDYTGPVTTPGLEQADVLNARLGWRWQTSDAIIVGAGVFTDRSTEPNAGNDLGQEKVDYYGVTAGFTWLTPLALLARPAGARPLVLSTTLAARYAFGTGSASVVDIDLVGGAVGSHTVPVAYHEIVPYIGSGVAF
jgi:hypothetical protein